MTAKTRLPAYNPAIESTDVPGVYFVESQYLMPSQMYTTDIYLETCNCPAGQRGVMCKHRRAAEAFHDARVLTLRAAVAA